MCGRGGSEGGRRSALIGHCTIAPPWTPIRPSPLRSGRRSRRPPAALLQDGEFPSSRGPGAQTASQPSITNSPRRAGDTTTRHALLDLKSVVLEEREGEHIVCHPRILEAAGHYHFCAEAVRAVPRQQKGKVERAIQECFLSRTPESSQSIRRRSGRARAIPSYLTYRYGPILRSRSTPGTVLPLSRAQTPPSASSPARSAARANCSS